MDAIYWVNCGYKLIVVVVVGLKWYLNYSLVEKEYLIYDDN
jgi:hypothetical protein